MHALPETLEYMRRGAQSPSPQPHLLPLPPPPAAAAARPPPAAARFMPACVPPFATAAHPNHRRGPAARTTASRWSRRLFRWRHGSSRSLRTARPLLNTDPPSADGLTASAGQGAQERGAPLLAAALRLSGQARSRGQPPPRSRALCPFPPVCDSTSATDDSLSHDRRMA